MRFFRDNYGWTMQGVLTFLTVGVIIGSVVSIMLINIFLVEGVETTVTGTIQLHQLKYNKFWDYQRYIS